MVTALVNNKTSNSLKKRHNSTLGTQNQKKKDAFGCISCLILLFKKKKKINKTLVCQSRNEKRLNSFATDLHK